MPPLCLVIIFYFFPLQRTCPHDQMFTCTVLCFIGVKVYPVGGYTSDLGGRIRTDKGNNPELGNHILCFYSRLTICLDKDTCPMAAGVHKNL